MRVLLAQELQVVGREIDDEQLSTWCQHASRFANGMSRLGEKVQHLVHDDRVDRRVRQSQRVNVTMAHLCPCHLRLRQLAARVRQHRLVEIEAQPTLVAVGKEFQYAARSSTKVDK